MNGNGLTVDASQVDASDQGDVSSGTVTISKAGADEQTVRLQGDCTVDFTAPDSGHAYSKVIVIDNDSGGSGGRVPTWNRAGGASNIYWLGSGEPSWSTQPAGAKTRVAGHYTSGGDLLLTANPNFNGAT